MIWPLALVVPLVGLSIPQDPDGDAESLSVTLSPDTGDPVGVVTVTVTVEVAAPSAGTLWGEAVTVTASLEVWVTVPFPLAAVLASVAVIVHVPGTVLDV